MQSNKAYTRMCAVRHTAIKQQMRQHLHRRMHAAEQLVVGWSL
jgi:hypothetical protein